MTPESKGQKSPPGPRTLFWAALPRWADPGKRAFPDRHQSRKEEAQNVCVTMFRCAFLVLLARLCVATPAAAQVIEPNAQPFSFPVLGGASFTVDRSERGDEQAVPPRGSRVDAPLHPGWLARHGAYCLLPDRHWGPVTLVGSTLEISGQKPRGGPGIPARIALSDVPPGGTITLRLLLQAPLLLLDLDGNATFVQDTFVEEYNWKVAALRQP